MTAPAAPQPLDSLLDLACRDGVDIRPTLLRVITDLYVQKPGHSAEEERQYVELALGLVDAVDAATRAAVTTRLAAYPSAPSAVLHRLSGIPASGETRAAAPAKPAAPPAPPQPDLVTLFFAAGADERRLILTTLDAAADPAARVPPPALPEVIRQFETAALKRNNIAFAQLVERQFGLGPAIAARIVRDHSGESIVVIAKALGMSAAVLQRVLLFLNPVVGQSVERVYDLAALYDEITPRAAAHMLSLWRQGGETRRATQVPVYADDAHRGARAAATPAAHRSERPQETQVPRSRVNDR